MRSFETKLRVPAQSDLVKRTYARRGRDVTNVICMIFMIFMTWERILMRSCYQAKLNCQRVHINKARHLLCSASRACAERSGDVPRSPHAGCKAQPQPQMSQGARPGNLLGVYALRSRGRDSRHTSPLSPRRRATALFTQSAALRRRADTHRIVTHSHTNERITNSPCIFFPRAQRCTTVHTVVQTLTIVE